MPDTRRWDGPELIGRRIPAPPSAPAPRRKRRWLRWLGIAVLIALLGPPALIALYRVVPPPLTPLMVIRSLDGLPMRQHWVPLSAISSALVGAVITTEDQNFCRHQGFDIEAIRAAWATYEQGGRLRGASTISQQTAKNLFLWPGQDYVRKGLEAYLTVWLELLWPKQRILEVYLNIIEWGPGLYGAEAAAQTHFGRPAASLTRRQAALLASVLPNPRQWSPTQPPANVERRTGWALARMEPFLRGCS